MMRFLRSTTAVVTGLLCAGGLLAVPQSGQVAAIDLVTQRSIVQYWGLTDSGEFFQTVPLDASITGNLGATHPEREFPLEPDATPTYSRAKDTDPPPPPPAPGGFVCSRAVSPPTVTSGLGTLHATVLQTCTGVFRSQWIDWQIKRSSYRGDLPYTDVHTSDKTSEVSHVFNVGANCLGGGTYNYRIVTNGYAIAGDGTLVRLKPVYGQAVPFNCGPGPAA
jgi:hypothetical protein